MIQEWIDEAEEYRDEVDFSTPNHSLGEGFYDDEGGIGVAALIINSVARQIMIEAHDQFRKYMEPEVKEMRNILEENIGYLEVSQALGIEIEAEHVVNAEDMHLVFVLKKEGEEKLIQPDTTEIVQEESDSSLVKYQFNYDHFPTHEEYTSEIYDITVKHISNAGKYELTVPWDEIR